MTVMTSQLSLMTSDVKETRVLQHTKSSTNVYNSRFSKFVDLQFIEIILLLMYIQLYKKRNPLNKIKNGGNLKIFLL